MRLLLGRNWNIFTEKIKTWWFHLAKLGQTPRLLGFVCWVNFYGLYHSESTIFHHHLGEYLCHLFQASEAKKQLNNWVYSENDCVVFVVFVGLERSFRFWAVMHSTTTTTRFVRINHPLSCSPKKEPILYCLSSDTEVGVYGRWFLEGVEVGRWKLSSSKRLVS